MALARDLRAIQDSLLEAVAPSRECTQIGGFFALIHSLDPMVWMNWASVTGKVSEQDISELVQYFKKCNRTPRLELFVELWPEACQLLRGHGFEISMEIPVMVLRRSEWQPSEPIFDVSEATTANLRPLRRALDIAFGSEEMDAEPDPQTVEAIVSGRFLGALVEQQGSVVAGGFAVGNRSIREIAGIGTVPGYRKRGCATAVIQHLLNRFFRDGGELAWLTPGHEEAQSLYEGLGFRSIGTQVCLTYPN